MVRQVLEWGSQSLCRQEAKHPVDSNNDSASAFDKEPEVGDLRVHVFPHECNFSSECSQTGFDIRL
jgi:hypothetical protein